MYTYIIMLNMIIEYERLATTNWSPKDDDPSSSTSSNPPLARCLTNHFGSTLSILLIYMTQERILNFRK